MRKIVCLLMLCFIAIANTWAATYYVSYSAGVDTYPGTLAQPFKTITKAVSVSVAGDVIYLRGGTHVYTTKISISKIGTAVNKFSLLAYPGDPRPVLDFSGMAVSSSNRGMQLSGQYWIIKGIDFYKAGDNGMHIDGANNIVEFCSFYENADTGLQIANGGNNNQIINCDSYYNKDAADGNADGFAAKLDVGTGNSFKGCRAWQNSDDGWDGLLTTGIGTNPVTTYDSCWCFMNGYLKAGTASVGNGNGFKMGGNNETHDATLTRCLSAYNRVKGFDQNNNNGSMLLYNCTGYKNNPNFGMNNNDPNAGKVMVVKNCISYGGLSSDVFRTVCTRTNNSWQTPFVVNNADFVAVDSIGLRNPRNADGSLPAINFMHLVNGSDLINGGVNVGLSYNGAAPDLGCFETNYIVPIVLKNFEAVLKNNAVTLNWQTATEINNKGWEIEKVQINTLAVNPWQTIGFVQGLINSTSTKSYLFTDNNIVAGAVYQYRLKQMDVDGKIKYSHIVTVKTQAKNNIEVITYPNPTTNSINIRFDIAKPDNTLLQVYNAQGVLLQTILNTQLPAGVYTKNISTNNLPAGNYIIKLQVANTTTSTSFVKK